MKYRGREVTKENVRELTKQNAEDLLKDKGKCVIVRNPGFGKTWLLTSLIKEYHNVLYLYPAEVIKNTVIDRWVDDEGEDIDMETIETAQKVGELPNCHLRSYMKLIRYTDDELKEMKFDLVVMDEVHRVGGEKTKEAVKKLMEYHPEMKFIGATATPTRSDGYNVIGELFNNYTVFPFTIHDAFKCGMLYRPYYCYCTYDVDTDLKEAALTAGEDINNLRVKEVLKAGLVEISKIYNLPKVIKSTCDEYSGGTYMKFIVFFHGLEHMATKKNDVKTWFHEAYPDYEIRTLEISSFNSELSNNVNKLNEFKKQSKTIDLIYCIDMLNMGYHVNDLTGIVMYRGTHSDIVYIQQLGRALSSGADRSCIVFDVVDNLHRKGMFTYPVPTQKRGNNTDNGEGSNVDIGVVGVDYIDGYGDGEDTDIDWYGTGGDGSSVDWGESMTIKPMDIIATGNEATYRELIAKVAAEPMSIRCEEAIVAHFRHWCEKNGIPYPINEDDLIKYGTSKEEFNKYFRNILKENKLDYPIDDAKQLLEIGKDRAEGIPPMEVFAKWKNVSVAAILDLLGIGDQDVDYKK